ncbi:MAG: DMT family transporter [Rhodocyclaceae bacterium]
MTAAAVLAFSLIWGYNWVIMKRALAFAGPFEFAALRHAFGTLALFAVMRIAGRSLRPPAPGRTALLGLLQTGLFGALVMAALATGGAGRSAVLTYTMPFWTLLIARLALGERIPRRRWPAVLAAVAGLAFVFAGGRPGGSLAGGVLASLAGLAWAGSAVLAKSLRARIELDSLSLTAWQMLFGSIVLVALALAVPERSIEWSRYLVFALLYNVILATAAAWLLWLWVLHRLTAGVAGLASLSIPVIGAAASAIELGERPSSAELFGMGLILLGLLLLARTEGRR